MKSDDPQIHGDAAILANIDAGIKNEVGGVEEISASQWESEYVKKKALTNSSPGSNQTWREEIGATTPLDTLSPRQAPVVAANPVAVNDTPAPSVRSLRERANVGRRFEGR